MTLHILKPKEKKQIERQLNEQFGIKKVPGIIIKTGTERLFLFQGNLDKKEILDLEKTIPIERIGVYFAKFQANKIRLSIEGVHILKDQITKNIFELDEKQTQQWMSGNELNIKIGGKDFLVMKYKNNFLGTGKASENKITNFIPKSRRLKNKN